MSIIYIKTMTPTLREAKRIGLMAKRIHAQDHGKCVLIGKVNENDPIWREPQWGKPRTRVHWTVGTKNTVFEADTYAWDRAEYLHENKPYWLAYLISWVDRFRTKLNCRDTSYPSRFAK